MDTSVSTQLKLPRKVKFFYGLGHVINDLMATVWFSYLLVYLIFIIELKDTTAGFLLLFGQVVDAVATPLVGIESDKGCWFVERCTGNFNNRKIWYFFGVILSLFSFPFIFVFCPTYGKTHEWTMILYLVPLIAVFQVGWAVIQVSHMALNAELSYDEKERDTLNLIRNIFTYVSALAVYVIAWIILTTMVSKGPQHSDAVHQHDAKKFRIISGIITILGLVSSIIFMLGSRAPSIKEEKKFHELSNNISEQMASKRKQWLKKPKFYQVSVTYTCSRLFVILSQIYVPLYLANALNDKEGKIASAPLVMNLSGFIVSLVFIRYLNKIMGKVIVFAFGSILGLLCVACLWLQQTNIHQSSYLYPLVALIGVAGTMMQVMSLSFVPALIGRDTDHSAFVYGSITFGDKLFNGILVVVIQSLNNFCQFPKMTYYLYVLWFGLGVPIVVSYVPLFLLSRGLLSSETEFKHITGCVRLKKKNREKCSDDQSGLKKNETASSLCMTNEALSIAE